jgi:hypothetical protein
MHESNVSKNSPARHGAGLGLVRSQMFFSNGLMPHLPRTAGCVRTMERLTGSMTGMAVSMRSASMPVSLSAAASLAFPGTAGSLPFHHLRHRTLLDAGPQRFGRRNQPGGQIEPDRKLLTFRTMAGVPGLCHAAVQIKDAAGFTYKRVGRHDCILS